MRYVTSDWHLGHKNILKYEPSSPQEPGGREKLILENCSKVNPEDTVYFLGDIKFQGNWDESIRKVTSFCTWICIPGNHDRKLSDTWWESVGFQDVYDSFILETKFGKSLLSHFPVNCWDERYERAVAKLRGCYIEENCSVNIHGHTHSRLIPYVTFNERPITYVNACVKANNFGLLAID